MTQNFKARFKWPDIEPGLPHIRETFTGQGKGIIVERILKRNLTNLLEVGSFLGASIDFWLNACSTLHVVAVDPWLDGWAGTHCNNLRYNEKCLLDLSPSSIDYLNCDDGLFKAFLVNMRQYRNRLTPIRSTIENAVPLLQETGYAPDIIYLDANKSYEMLEILWKTWPDCILSGDDYKWRDTNNVAVMRDNVNRFADAHAVGVMHMQDTWMLMRN